MRRIATLFATALVLTLTAHARSSRIEPRASLERVEVFTAPLVTKCDPTIKLCGICKHHFCW